MKPREMYSGAAPAAMGMMGQGLAEVGSNIARSTLAGYQALGEGLSKGIQSATGAIAGAYADYKKMGSEIKAAKGFYESLRDSKLLPKEIQKNIDSTINSESYKHSSTQDKAAYWSNIRSLAGQSIAHTWSMDKLIAEGKNRMDITKTDIEGRKDLEELKAFYDFFKSRGFGVSGGGGTGKGQGSATPTEYGTPSDEVPTFDHSVGGGRKVSGGVVNGLPVADANAPAMTKDLFGGNDPATQEQMIVATQYNPNDLEMVDKIRRAKHTPESYNALDINDKWNIVKKK